MQRRACVGCTAHTNCWPHFNWNLCHQWGGQRRAHVGCTTRTTFDLKMRLKVGARGASDVCPSLAAPLMADNPIKAEPTVSVFCASDTCTSLHTPLPAYNSTYTLSFCVHAHTYACACGITNLSPLAPGRYRIKLPRVGCTTCTNFQLHFD